MGSGCAMCLDENVKGSLGCMDLNLLGATERHLQAKKNLHTQKKKTNIKGFAFACLLLIEH